MSRNDDADCKRNGRQLVEPMEPARRMNVAQRDGEDQRRASEPRMPTQLRAARPRTAADHVVALVDGFQKRFEVGLGPGFLGRGHEHQRQAGSLETTFQRTRQGRSRATGTTQLSTGRPKASIRSARGTMHAFAIFARQVGEQDDPNPGVRQRISLDVLGERVVVGLVVVVMRIPAMSVRLPGEPCARVLAVTPHRAGA